MMKLKPFVSAGEVFVHEDGLTFEMAPLEVFRCGDDTIIRIGRNTYHFTPDGTYDGPECDSLRELAPALAKALEESIKNRGQRPKESYFEPGTKGHAAETALWPKNRN